MGEENSRDYEDKSSCIDCHQRGLNAGTEQLGRLSALFIIICILVSCPLAIVRAEVKTLDLSAGDPSDSKYYVVFASRPPSIGNLSFAGHAFVAIGHEDATRQLSIQYAYGLYPSYGIGLLGPVPGSIQEEALNSRLGVNRMLIVRVQKNQYDNLSDFIASQPPPVAFRLTQQDCVTFVDAVAKRLGLKTPKRDIVVFTPGQYLQSLTNENIENTPPAAAGQPFPMPNPTPASTPAPLATGVPGVPFATPSALLSYYQALVNAEDHPESNIEIVFGITNSRLVNVSVRSIRMRADAGIPGGDAACLYADGDLGRIGNAQIAALANNLSSLSVGSQTDPSAALGVDLSHPMLGVPASWSVVPAPNEGCYDSSREQPGQRIGVMIRTERPRYPKDASPFNMNVPIQFGRSSPYPNLTARERAWRQYRDRVDYLKQIYDQRLSAYPKLNTSQIKLRKQFENGLAADSTAKFQYRLHYANLAEEWDRLLINQKNQAARTADQHSQETLELMKSAAAINQRLLQLTGITVGGARSFLQLESWILSNNSQRVESRALNDVFSYQPSPSAEPSASRGAGHAESPIFLRAGGPPLVLVSPEAPVIVIRKP